MQPTITPTPASGDIYGRPEYSPYTAPVPPVMPPLPPALQPGFGQQQGQTGQQRTHTTAGMTSPGLAFMLGWIPGVGAIYNGQYAKGLVHAMIFGLLVSILDHVHGGFEPLFGICMAAFVFYMPFEAYHTAKRRMLGQPVDEFSSIFKYDPGVGRFPIGPVLLIVAGFLFLLSNFDLIRIEDILRFWPVALIGFGVYMLLGRVRAERRP